METIVADIKEILDRARKKAYEAASYAMIEAYWLIGKRIVEQEQSGERRAQYGREILQRLSEELGKGFSERTLRDIRKCYLTFPDWKDLAHACAKLEWSHIRAVTKVNDTDARKYYLREATSQNWSVKTLERNIESKQLFASASAGSSCCLPARAV